MNRLKEIAKYCLNTLTIINALLVGLSPIWNWDCDRVIQTISVVMAVISTYLLGNKAYKTICDKGECK
ncbi:hypothetical protein [uncultured Eubacterium sp.]|uniref:hypothetical protein n=1 Tax=uncultured Eubacterium sp. TaxID=165185 RepID=UPI0015B1FA0C|nr:hypothetical protein [uncultured Eubacterium sp.]